MSEPSTLIDSTYQQAIAPSRAASRLLRADQAVLMVVDIQEKFTPIIHEIDRVVARTGILIQAARQLGIPIVVTEQYPKGLGHTLPELKALLSSNLQDASGAASGASGTHVQYFEKHTFGCLGCEPVAEHLAKLQRPQVLLCGVETHVCLNQTAHQLLEAGYQVHLAEDAISSRDPENKRIGMAKMLQSGAIPACTEMILFELIRTATHPNFKSLLGFIK